MTSKHSSTPFGLPGKLMMSVWFRTPTTCREVIANGVFSNVRMRMASAIPGMVRWMTSLVASGVTSRGPRPVPPVVAITSTFSVSQRCVRHWTIAALSSGRICVRITSNASSRNLAASSGPLVLPRSVMCAIAQGDDSCCVPCHRYPSCSLTSKSITQEGRSFGVAANVRK